MKSEIFIFGILTALVCTVGLGFYYLYAKKNQIIDRPNERSSHTHSPVRGMGIVLLLVLLLLWIYTPEYGFLIGGAVIANVTGYLDDRIGLKRRWRLILYMLSLILVLLNLPSNFAQSWMYLVPSAVLALGIINAYNFMDGINGITGLYTLILVGTVGLINFTLIHSAALGFLCISLGLFCLAFGWFNYRKLALAFMGDSGSVALGVLATFMVVYTGLVFEDWKVIVLLAVYGVDTVGTIIYRLIKRENIFEAHRSHIYQDLVHKLGWSHLKVALTYSIMQALINVYVYSKLMNGMAIDVLSIVIILGLLTITYVMLKLKLGLLKFG